ncbi:MAG: glutathione synthase [Deltaproteobacteria bacterium]|nr:glutathione synthase [Sandaracinaceae bacterium]MCX7807222.1 glutathione synthase [Deltaproteobacteria bacterium]MDW8246006.1 glutathione synthase [Sandaracinaceae bacterium]
MPLRLLFVMDPPEKIQADSDTSFALIEEAVRRGHRVDHCLITNLFVHSSPGGARAGAWVRPVTPSREGQPPLVLGPKEAVFLSEFQAIFVRKDPPFDRHYLWATQVLELARGQSLIINDPRGLREANEKLYALHFPELMPRTIVTSEKESIIEFMETHGGMAVIKPLYGAGGHNVFLLRTEDPNHNAIIENLTEEGQSLVMVQQYLPEVSQGDKRILLVDGEAIGAILRIPRPNDLRSNLHAGGRAAPAAIDDADRRIIDAMKERLRADGLFFVGLDVIGGKLTEVNVTSPTGIQQMSRFSGQNLSARVLDWIEKRL